MWQWPIFIGSGQGYRADGDADCDPAGWAEVRAYRTIYRRMIGETWSGKLLARLILELFAEQTGLGAVAGRPERSERGDVFPADSRMDIGDAWVVRAEPVVADFYQPGSQP